MHEIKRALFSVSDKTGAIEFARFLAARGVEILSTGGTGKALAEAGIAHTPMEKITGNPEAFGGRMKTISFPFASSLLFRRDHAGDVETARKMGVEPIDLVVCNLYPFHETRRRGADDATLVEDIDVGGPTMIRAAAKNHNHVAVATDPSQYDSLISEITEARGTSLATRKHLAVHAFRLLAAYDSAIADELSSRFLGEETLHLSLDQGRKLRYGENPHQSATFYRDEASASSATSIATAEILQGKALSYNNILDADAALRSASDALLALGSTSRPVVAIVKHLNPCGLASGRTSLEALELAWEGDPVSAFGGILCFTETFTAECATWLSDKFVEIIVAPSVAPDALGLLAKKKNLRVLLCAPRPAGKTPERMLRSVSGGLLVQEEDEGVDAEFKSVTRSGFPDSLLPLARFGVMACKHLRSNAIALVRTSPQGNFQLVGAGMGQPNRLDSIRALAGPRAAAKNATMAELLLVSDAFFPFADGIEAAHELGVKFVVQPGGSIKDEEVIAMADKLGMSMALTGRRHFRH